MRISFEASLDSLRPRGLMVSFGASSGAPAAVELSTLNGKGSLFLTRPSIVAHTASTAEYQERAADGIWYRASGYELRGKGVMATWSAADREPTECRAVD